MTLASIKWNVSGQFLQLGSYDTKNQHLLRSVCVQTFWSAESLLLNQWRRDSQKVFQVNIHILSLIFLKQQRRKILRQSTVTLMSLETSVLLLKIFRYFKWLKCRTVEHEMKVRKRKQNIFQCLKKFLSLLR